MTARVFFEFLNRWRVFVQMAFVVVLTAGYVSLQHRNFIPLQDVENRILDWRFEARAPRPTPEDVVILGIYEIAFHQPPSTPEELARMPELAYLTDQWPFNRALW